MSNIQQAAHDKFNQIIREGATRAQAVFDRIARDVPEDRIARGRAMGFSFGAPRMASVHAINPQAKPYADELTGSQLLDSMLEEPQPKAPQQPAPPSKLLMSIADHTQAVHAHALGQLAERFRLHGVKIPVRYIRALVDSGDADSQAIAEAILNQTAAHPAVKDQRFLVRSVRDEARAVMSDKYRRIDCRPILDELAAFLKNRGMVPIGGFGSDTRVQLQFAIPEVFDLADGESPLLIGGTWSNSDFGHGSNGLAMFAMRMWCTNGATSQNQLRQVHHGSRLPDDVQLAADTLAADTKANRLVMRDTLNSILSRDKVDELIASLRDANVTKTSWKDYEPRLKKLLGKGELETAKKAFEGEDVINLPAGQTRWRMSNAISWIANSASPSRAIELQRLAGSIAHGERRLDLDDAVIAA